MNQGPKGGNVRARRGLGVDSAAFAYSFGYIRAMLQILATTAPGAVEL